MRRNLPIKLPGRSASANAIAKAKSARRGNSRSRRGRAPVDSRKGPFLPPEMWYEPPEEYLPNYQIVTQDAGAGYRHVVTSEEVAQRLSELPSWMTEQLNVVQLSRMTRKKRLFPCYGMQWGSAVYLYPIEETLVEHYDRPPRVSVFNESRMFGGHWQELSDGQWRLHWSLDSVRDFYLNNILIHELGHLLDHRNSNAADRERFAEWFAIEHGYRPTHRARLARLASLRIQRKRHGAR